MIIYKDELANQWKQGCMREIYAWNDLDTPTAVDENLVELFNDTFDSSRSQVDKRLARS